MSIDRNSGLTPSEVGFGSVVDGNTPQITENPSDRRTHDAASTAFAVAGTVSSSIGIGVGRGYGRGFGTINPLAAPMLPTAVRFGSGVIPGALSGFKRYLPGQTGLGKLDEGDDLPTSAAVMGGYQTPSPRSRSPSPIGLDVVPDPDSRVANQSGLHSAGAAAVQAPAIAVEIPQRAASPLPAPSIIDRVVSAVSSVWNFFKTSAVSIYNFFFSRVSS